MSFTTAMTIGSEQVQNTFVFNAAQLKGDLPNNPRNRARISCATSQGGVCATPGCMSDILNKNNLNVNADGTRALCHTCHIEGTRGPKSESWNKAQRHKKAKTAAYAVRVKRKFVHEIRTTPAPKPIDAVLDADFDAVLNESMRLFGMSTHVHWGHPMKYNLVGAKRQRLF